jgi:hypothetical protein
LPKTEEVERVIDILAERRQCTVGELVARFDPGRRAHMERGLVWMAKYGMLQILGRSNIISG